MDARGRSGRHAREEVFRPAPARSGRGTGPPVPLGGRLPRRIDRSKVCACANGHNPMLREATRSSPARPGPNRTIRSQPVDRIQMDVSESVSTRSIRENKDSADIMTWREYEALRNEMRREFRTEDDELKGTVEEIKQTLDATNETVTGLSDQMTDIQRSLQALQLAVENLTNNNNNKMMRPDEDSASW
ncbi:hypothetical protein QYE76_023585 [Lolium multiflorum]|uniref:Uncharacterized protein n=1 Tax=Lolium multiflorum TaxID=4521 RepID=A0AAD8RAI9_LOLMU|nr:hypothetical protein QYE76_023585 [Lolium multiflorum]